MAVNLFNRKSPSKKQKKDRDRRVKEWLNFLRANPDKQTYGLLHIVHNDKMCCLGALCYLNPDLIKKTSETCSYDGCKLVSYDDSTSVLPRKIAGYFGFYSYDGRLQNYYMEDSLASLNDTSHTWPEIADFIEQNPEKVFKY